MIRLRAFEPEDDETLARYVLPGSSPEQRFLTLAQWAAKRHAGRFYERLAVEDHGTVVGTVSLSEGADGKMWEGVAIFPPYRRQGYAEAAVTLAITLARHAGYACVWAEIAADNAPSRALHEKLGFAFAARQVNAQGQEVVWYRLACT